MHTLHNLRRALQGCPDIDRLHTLAVVERHHHIVADLTDRRVARLSEAQVIEALSEGGQVGVIVWSRDCDHVCGESKSIIPATLKAYDDFRDRQLDGAEGPMTFRLCRPSQPFKSWSRDMVLEAYENGHAHRVTDAYVPATPLDATLPARPEDCEFGDDEYQWRLRQAGL